MKLLTQEYKEHWNTSSKVLFRLLFTYFVLYILLAFLSPLLETPYRWIGKAIFEIDYEYKVSGYGSGDHTFAYLTLFVNAVLTFIVVSLWSLLDGKRKSYNSWLYWFLVFLRIVLIATMFLYGFVKIFKIQFPSASLVRLLEPLGDFSPMGLAWTYMGFSKSFNVFAGSLEVLGGLLLIPRRTQTLGSFIIIGVMTQVAMMNFCYDIPVKLFSIHLILMASVIFITDHRFLDVFIKNKSVEKYNYFHPIKNVKYHERIFWIKSIGSFILVTCISIFIYTATKDKGDNRIKPLLYGIWEVSSFTKNGKTLPPLITDYYRWRYLIVDRKGYATVKTMDDEKHFYQLNPDSTAQKISIHKREMESEEFNFSYETKDNSFLQLDGVLQSDTAQIRPDTLQIKLYRKDHEKFILNARGFNWINERPFNK